MMFAAAYPLARLLELITEGTAGILPELTLVFAFLLAILAEIWPGKGLRAFVPGIAMLGTATAGILAFLQLHANTPPQPEGIFLGMISADRFAAWCKVLVVLPALVSMLASLRSRKLKAQSTGTGEYYLMLLAMLIGLFFLAMARNLLMVFLALEMVSLPSYVLTAYTRLNKKSAEASLKYVIYGCFSSGVMLYGLSWVFGITGSLDPSAPEFLQSLSAAPAWTQTFALILVLGGLSFKIGTLPFHFWVPDVYEGAPYPVAAFFSVAPKAAGFAALLRFLSWFQDPAAAEIAGRLSLFLGILAVGSMFLGNLSALRQQNFRRLLGYSSIAQAGYMLAGAAFMSLAGTTAVTFYLLIYTLMTYGAFMVAGWMNEQLGSEDIDDLKGLAASLPGLAVVLSVLMVSLTGLPPTAGFIAKLELFLAGVSGMGAAQDALILGLMIAMVLNTVISLFYYLRPPVMMVFKNPGLKSVPGLHSWQKAVLGITALALVWLGIISFDGLIHFIGEFVQEMNGRIRF